MEKIEKPTRAKKWCQKCGKVLNESSPEYNPRGYNFGFKTVQLDLCISCAKKVEERIPKIDKKYSNKLLKMYNKYFQEILR